MHAVGDELGRDLRVVEGGADGARLAMMERRHGVAQVRHLPRAGLDGRARGVVVGLRVRDGHAHIGRHRSAEVEGTVHFGRHVHKLDQVARTLLEPAEHGLVGQMEVGRILRADVVGRDVGPLHVDAHERRAAAAQSMMGPSTSSGSVMVAGQMAVTPHDASCRAMASTASSVPSQKSCPTHP